MSNSRIRANINSTTDLFRRSSHNVVLAHPMAIRAWPPAAYNILLNNDTQDTWLGRMRVSQNVSDAPMIRAFIPLGKFLEYKGVAPSRRCARGIYNVLNWDMKSTILCVVPWRPEFAIVIRTSCSRRMPQKYPIVRLNLRRVPHIRRSYINAHSGQQWMNMVCPCTENVCGSSGV